MTPNEEVYTYRAGKKIALTKQPDQFVVRALPSELKQKIGIADAMQVSTSSSRVVTAKSELEPLMNRARNVAPTHHVYRVSDTQKEFLITDRVIVSFREPLTSEEIGSFAGRYGLFTLEAYSDRDYLFQLTDQTGINPVKLVVTLMEDEPLVESAEHDLNYLMNKYGMSMPTDPSYPKQWHLHTRCEDPSFDPRASTRCEEAWELLGHHGSPDVVIGVTDDGCRLDHADFDSADKFAGWGYFKGPRLITNKDVDADPRSMYEPGSDHGTSCSGVIGAEIDALLTVGAAPGCRLLPIKWESSGPSLFISDSKLLRALNYVQDKVDILSNSWGGVPVSLWPDVVIRRITELAQTGGRRGQGILFLWAAGNENCPIQYTAPVDVPYTSGVNFRSDGSLVWVGVEKTRVFTNNLVGVPGVLHVAALASTAQRSHYSNYGTGISICAPTSNVHEYYRMPVQGLGITTAEGQGVTDSFGGTSSATPLTAGIAALVLSANPHLSALELASILKRTASKDLSLEGYAKTPPALFDPDPSWDVSPIVPFDRGDFQDIQDADGTWSPWFGHGRADAKAAVEEALRWREEHQGTRSLEGEKLQA
ncbi:MULTISPECIES: S8 family serine peptidase [Paenibacillus]|uniref:S8 family serine peptidase n=1 Tax=Paenibacillus TaxID=44249 RepID=UPI0022B8B239|nr:S8 family serine peptidase [Paenibacillus caseinilyticus]MCZ8522453.1 S8 family serine peptidase [Paenibacillus caseinilyticus]